MNIKPIKEMISAQGVTLQYIKVKCPKCFNTWGITIFPQDDLDNDLFVCKRCFENSISRKRSV